MKLETRTRRYEKAREEWELAIVAAYESGEMSFREIGRVAGLTHRGVTQLLRRRGVLQ